MDTDINFIIQPMFDINIFGRYHRFPIADPIIGASLILVQYGIFDITLWYDSPLMFDIEHFQKVNFTRSTEKASQTLFEHVREKRRKGPRNSARAQSSRRCVVHTLLQHYSWQWTATKTTNHIDRWAIELRSQPIQPIERLEAMWKYASTSSPCNLDLVQILQIR